MNCVPFQSWRGRTTLHVCMHSLYFESAFCLTYWCSLSNWSVFNVHVNLKSFGSNAKGKTFHLIFDSPRSRQLGVQPSSPFYCVGLWFNSFKFTLISFTTVEQVTRDRWWCQVRDNQVIMLTKWINASYTSKRQHKMSLRHTAINCCCNNNLLAKSNYIDGRQ